MSIPENFPVRPMSHFESCGKCHSAVCTCKPSDRFCLACEDGASNEGAPCTCGNGKPIPCHDHRADGPDPYPDCKCSAIDKLFRSSGRARTPLLERNPPPAMLIGARFDRIHKEVGRSRAARVGRSRVTPGCLHCQDLLENNMGLRKLLNEAVSVKTEFVGGAEEAHQLVLADLDDVCGERDRLRAALKSVAHGIDEGGDCWCMYFKVVHPSDDPQDALKTYDGHTTECWQARAAMRRNDEPALCGSEQDDEDTYRRRVAEEAVVKENKPRTCNRHIDCDAADARALKVYTANTTLPRPLQRANMMKFADHCYDSDCEDCFGT